MNGETDVLIIGGGIIGMSTAVHLKLAKPSIGVAIIEPDPTYSLAATPRASGGIRQAFALPENIALSMYTIQIIREWPSFLAGSGSSIDLSWRPQGYLLIAKNGGEYTRLKADLVVQNSLGVPSRWVGIEEIARRYPQIRSGDLLGGLFSPEDGWLDPYSMLQGFKARALSLGVEIVRDRVIGTDVEGTAVTGVTLEHGNTIAAGAVVNTAGVWGADLAKQVGIPMPVEPMKRFAHYVDVEGDFADYPVLKDLDGLAVRPEGKGLSVGLVNYDQRGGFDVTPEPRYFEECVWPALIERMPSLDRLRLRSTMVGLYDQNRLDGNVIVGTAPDHLSNYYFACGTSGHGVMHAPGIGRGIAELLVHGDYITIDLERLGYRRVLEEQPLSSAAMN